MKTTLALMFATAALLAITPRAASACEVCFGVGADSPVVTAIGLSMLSLLLIVGFVLTGITKFFVDMSRRARGLDESGYDDHVSGNGRAH